MKNFNENFKEEALRRMKALDLHDAGFHTCVGQFRKNCKAWKSEFYGALYVLDDDEQAIVDEFEKEHPNHKVYHCYKAHTQFGEILYMLFVSDEKGEAKMFDVDLKDNITFTYAYNMTDPMLSEFGSCYIKSMFGGIVLR